MSGIGQKVCGAIKTTIFGGFWLMPFSGSRQARPAQGQNSQEWPLHPQDHNQVRSFPYSSTPIYIKKQGVKQHFEFHKYV